MSSTAPIKRYVRHSAEVQMYLVLNGRALPIAQLGPDFLLLEDPVEHPPTTADIVLKVDNHEDRWTVRLPEGLRLGQKRVLIAIL